MVKRGQAVRSSRSEVRDSLRLSCDRGVNCDEADESTPARKAAKISCKAPVPQTDTGRRQENCKTSGITIVKELGKMTP